MAVEVPIKRRISDTAFETLTEMVRQGKCFRNEPMARHTTMKIGGPAEVYLEPASEEFGPVVTFLRKNGIPLTVIGRGSNLLVSDSGIEGAVLSTGGLNGIAAKADHGPVITAGAGASLSAAARAAEDDSLTGLEFASGIPGSVGGAIYMNAGAYGGEMRDVVRRVTAVTPEGQIVRIPDTEEIPDTPEADPALGFGYRQSAFQHNDLLILTADLRLKRGDPREIRRKMEDFAARRRLKQPLEYPSAGSAFKRPEGHFAGQLIDESGLRGYRIGDAAVSEKHCGFLVNLGNATAADMYALIRHVIRTVEEKTGIRLEPEIRLLGKF